MAEYKHVWRPLCCRQLVHVRTLYLHAQNFMQSMSASRHLNMVMYDKLHTLLCTPWLLGNIQASWLLGNVHYTFSLYGLTHFFFFFFSSSSSCPSAGSSHCDSSTSKSLSTVSSSEPSVCARACAHVCVCMDYSVQYM